MYLIALSGGSIAERTKVAERLLVAARGRLNLCAQVNLTLSGKRRLVQLEGHHAVARAHSLSESLRGLKGTEMQGRGFIVAHCMTAEEAQVVREMNGVIWHIYSRPSGYVAIRKGDAIINGDGGSFRHISCPIEALSSYLLASRAQRPEVQ